MWKIPKPWRSRKNGNEKSGEGLIIRSEPPRGKHRGITSGVARVQAALAQISLDLGQLHPRDKPSGFAGAVIKIC